MKKVNKNAEKIYKNRGKFLVGESYSYKNICEMCDIKFYQSGDSRKKQIDTFKSLFDVEEYKVSRTTMYKILSVKELTDNESKSLVADKRGTNINSHNNKKSEYSDSLMDSLLANIYIQTLQEEQENVSTFEHIDDRYFRIETDKFNLSCLMGIRNRDNFKNARTNKFDFCDNAKVNIKSFEHIYPKTNDSIYKATNYILNQLKDSGHINFRETMKVLIPKFKDEDGYVLEDEDIDNNVLEEYNAEDYDKYLIDKIKALRGEVANKLGYKSLSKIYNSSDQVLIDKFNELLNETVKEKLGVHKFYPRIMLVVNKESLLNYFLNKDMTLEDISRIGTTDYIQHRIEKMIKDKEIVNDEKAIKEKLDNIAKKHKTEEPFFDYNKVQLNKYYDKDLKKLSNLLIDPMSETVNVNSEIKESKIIKTSKRRYTRKGYQDRSKIKVVNSKEDEKLIKELSKL